MQKLNYNLYNIT